MNTPLTPRRRALLIACTAAALTTTLALTACSSTSRTGASTTDADVSVVASTTHICDYVTQLASGSVDLALSRTGADGITQHLGADAASASTHISLTCLLAPNASAHEHDLTAAQAAALAEADLFLVNGVDLEHFLDAAVTATGFHGTMVVTSGVAGAADLTDLAAQEATEASLPYTVDRGIQSVDVAPWPFAPEEGEEAEFSYDPHVWTNPAHAITQVRNIGAALEAAVPQAADLLHERTQAYIALLESLDAWAEASLSSVPASQRVLFTSHDAFGYLSQRYDILFEGAALSDFNAQADATASKIQEIADLITASGAVAIFAENSNNSASVEKVAQLAGVRAIIGDEALYGDSLGTAGTDGETYIGSLLHNVTNLTLAWGGTVAPIPEELSTWAPTSTLENS